ncbi:hypothetical protein [Parasitella parasitica]|uniref:Uncharacterized protein n=1 Tax=Parasitella parasitica TaxID=35722 RepID=A0A0B7NCF9_9FUNG|nr:hypothetical protein [Parasitella parasitica]
MYKQFFSDDNVNLMTELRNLIESLPRTKFNALIRESSLSCSYVHCILNPIFTSPENSTHLIWLNTQTVKESDKQPGFVGNTLVGSQFEGPVVVGDVEGEDRKSDTNPCLLDLIRIGILSGYDGVIGVHVVGVQQTCYIVSLMGCGVYIMLELCTITLPKDFTEIRSHRSNHEELKKNDEFPHIQDHYRMGHP